MRSIHRRMIAAAMLIACAVLASAGCAAMKATQQPSKRDLSVLTQGVPRTHVIAELGSPVHTGQRNGDTVDVYSFTQGYSKTTKAARALVHGAADVFTLGLWEVVGIPTEMLIDGTDVQVEVQYDHQQHVKDIAVIQGEKAFDRPKLFGGNRYAHNRQGGLIRAREPNAKRARQAVAHGSHAPVNR